MNRLSHLKPQPASLSSKVLWVTVIAILVIESLALLPVLGRQRLHWMYEVQSRANVAAYALQSASPTQAARILRLAGIHRLTLVSPSGQQESWTASDAPPPTNAVLIPEEEHLSYSIWRTCLRIAGLAPAEQTLLFTSPLSATGGMAVQVSAAPLTFRMRLYARRGVSLIVLLSMLAGLVVYGVLNKLLVQPMEILTASIIRFREAPEEADHAGLDLLAARPRDDISTAARELKAMQSELRGALWRNARLAAVGTAVAKIAHDLRNVLSSALLVADRLQGVEDPVVQRATRTLIPAVERATQFVSRTVEFAREGPPPITRSLVRIWELIEEVANTVRPASAKWRIENLVPEMLELPMDRDQLYRVLTNLIRNAAEAGATLITLSTEIIGDQTKLRVLDNGPGLPPKALANLFKPFTGSVRSGGTGLGLTIARDLIRAHGGDLVLEHSGPDGTVFCMDLATHDPHTPPLFASRESAL